MQFFTDAEAQDILRESRGLDSIFSLLKTAKHLSIKQYSMFALGCALARNVSSQMALCKPEVFQFLKTVLCDGQELLKLKCVAAFLINMLICNNGAGQKLTRECNVLPLLMDIFRTTWSTSDDCLDIHSVTFNLLLSVCNALSAAVNNPQNVENQRMCCSLVPFMSKVFPSLFTSTQLSPFAGFLISCVTNHFMNQERVRAVGVLRVLVEQVHSQDVNMEDNLSSCVLLLDALVHCSNVNKSNQQVLVDLQIIPNIVRVLELVKEPSSLLKVLTCLQMLTSDYSDGQKQVEQCGGIAILVQLLAESQDEDLKQVSLLVLQSCLKQRLPVSDDSSPPAADIAIERLEVLMDKLMSHDVKMNHLTPAKTAKSHNRGQNTRASELPPDVSSDDVEGILRKKEDALARVSQRNEVRERSPRSFNCNLGLVNAAISQPQTRNHLKMMPSNIKVLQPNKPTEVSCDKKQSSWARTESVTKAHITKSSTTSISSCTSTSASGRHETAVPEADSIGDVEALSSVPMQKTLQGQPQGNSSAAVIQLQNISTHLEQIRTDLSLLEAHHKQSEQSVKSQLRVLQGDLKKLHGAHQESRQSTCPDNNCPRATPTIPDACGNVKGVSHSTRCKECSEVMTVSTPLYHQTPFSGRHLLSSGNSSRPLEKPRRHPRCTMCTSISNGTKHFSNSRNLMKRVYNDSHTCAIHEGYAKQAFAAKCHTQRRTDVSVGSAIQLTTSSDCEHILSLPSPIRPSTSIASVGANPLTNPLTNTSPLSGHTVNRTADKVKLQLGSGKENLSVQHAYMTNASHTIHSTTRQSSSKPTLSRTLRKDTSTSCSTLNQRIHKTSAFTCSSRSPILVDCSSEENTCTELSTAHVGGNTARMPLRSSSRKKSVYYFSSTDSTPTAKKPKVRTVHAYVHVTMYYNSTTYIRIHIRIYYELYYTIIHMYIRMYVRMCV
jgi:hypothetical protein